MQSPNGPSPSSKTHRRSRTGCFTCRLRRKKCDEGKSRCKACINLGLDCQYKRPSWWGNISMRKQQKEAIKNLIKKTKQTEKVAAITQMNGFPRPTRSHSVDSGFSLEYDYENDPDFNKYSDMQGYAPQTHYVQTVNQEYYPQYEHGVLAEKQNYANIMAPPSRRDSALCGSISIRRDSTFAATILPSMPENIYPTVEDSPESYEAPVLLPTQPQPVDDLGFNFVDFGAFGESAPIPLMSEGDRDQPLLDHFVVNVLPLMLPVLDLNVAQAHDNFIKPALQSNRAYLHSCLGASAMHLKATLNIEGNDVDEDILRHRKSTIEELCESMNGNSDQLQILEAILGVILFRSSVGTADDSLPDIAWHNHFQPAMKLIHQMDLATHLQPLTAESQSSNFNMTLAAWIDILGATMLGRMPVLADTYRTKYLSSESSGLSDLMGCDDRVMYLISEIACLEAHKLNGISDDILLEQVTALARQIDYTEPLSDPVMACQGQDLDTVMLSDLMTAAFRCAARIYLTSLVPGCKDGIPAPFDHQDGAIQSLLNKLTTILEAIPAGPGGFDRSLVWVYLIGGSVATPGSSFRSLLMSRMDGLAEESNFGSFGSMVNLISNVWQKQDMSGSYVHWRDVMTEHGWDFLMI